MHDGANRSSVSNDGFVRALCASSMMMTGFQSRSTLASDGITAPFSYLSSPASTSPGRPEKCCSSAPAYS